MQMKTKGCKANDTTSSIEKEYKFLVSKDEYDKILRYSGTEKNQKEEIVQINYYYDFKNFVLNKRGTTLRVRQIRDDCVLQIKNTANKSAAYRESMEMEKKISGVPSQISPDELIGIPKVEGKNLYLQGCMVTKRTKFKYPYVSLDVDMNLYLGKCDYEVEIEFDDENYASALLTKYNLSIINSKSKANRFFDQKEKENNYD